MPERLAKSRKEPCSSLFALVAGNSYKISLVEWKEVFGVATSM